MRLVFDPAAADDLDRIFDWVAKDNPQAARSVLAGIENKIGQLAYGFPKIGRPGRTPGTRELVSAPYVIVYELREQLGEVLVRAVFHGAQGRSPSPD